MGIRAGILGREDAIFVIGSGTRFLSGISVYTARLSATLAERRPVTAVLLRRLLPSRLYPGHRRVGHNLDRLSYGTAEKLDGVDWFWVPGLFRFLWKLERRRPTTVIFQWWTGAVLHTYLAMAVAAKVRGSRIIIELHETQDTGEARLAFARRYTRLLFSRFAAMASAFVVHSSEDVHWLREAIDVGLRPVLTLSQHGPYDHYKFLGAAEPATAAGLSLEAGDAVRLLYFGVIRPYKGVEHLLEAFNTLCRLHGGKYSLTVVGETWEGWTRPALEIAASPFSERITFVNRYVHDTEVDGYFSHADVVVLPYLRASMSGPVQVAMAYGLPLVVSDIPGLREMVRGYGGAVLMPPGDPAALAEAIERASRMRGQTFAHPSSWSETAQTYLGFVNTVLCMHSTSPAQLP